MNAVSYEGWERWKQEHPALIYSLPAWAIAEAEKQAQADLQRQLFLVEAFANQRIER